MLKIGSHVGMNGPEYYLGSVKEALSYNETTFMFYTGAPQNSIRTPLDKLKIEEAINLLSENNINPKDVVVHAPYLINLGNLDQEKVEISYRLLETEVIRTLAMGSKYLVLHPGASINYDRNESINQVAKLLNKVTSLHKDICILLETMAGKGSEIGISFEELSYIISKIENKDSIGVCLDTCHIHDNGFDLNNFDKVLDDFDKIIGLDYLKVIHVNDSKNERGSHKDRHENIGYGKIGFNNIINIVYNERINNKIFILETPYINVEGNKESYPPYKFEIESIRKKEFNSNLYQDVINYYKK